MFNTNQYYILHIPRLFGCIRATMKNKFIFFTKYELPHNAKTILCIASHFILANVHWLLQLLTNSKNKLQNISNKSRMTCRSLISLILLIGSHSILRVIQIFTILVTAVMGLNYIWAKYKSWYIKLDLTIHHDSLVWM